MVDHSLIDEMLAMSVEERLRANDRSLAAIEQLQSAYAAHAANDSRR